MTNKNQTPTVKPVKTSLTYEDEVIKKIIGHALETVDGLLGVSGGFLTDLKNKTFNSEAVTDGVNVEVGTKEVAVDLDVIVEYKKDIPKIAEDIKALICKDVKHMTHLTVVEVNIKVVDIKTKEQHEADSVTLQDRLEDVAQSTGQFVAQKADEAKEVVKGTGAKLADKANDVKEDIETEVAEATEPRVK